MKRRNQILAICLALGAGARAEASDAQVLRSSLGSIALGDAPAIVKRKLGQPIETEETGDYLGSRWRYDGIDIYFHLDPPVAVGQIESTSPRHCTANGVCPGQSLAAASAKLGSPMGGGSLKEGTNSYAVQGEACWLEVDVQHSLVSGLAIKCQP